MGDMGGGNLRDSMIAMVSVTFAPHFGNLRNYSSKLTATPNRVAVAIITSHKSFVQSPNK